MYYLRLEASGGTHTRAHIHTPTPKRMKADQENTAGGPHWCDFVLVSSIFRHSAGVRSELRMIDDERPRGQNEPLNALGEAESKSGAVSAWFLSFHTFVTFYIQQQTFAKYAVY